MKAEKLLRNGLTIAAYKYDGLHRRIKKTVDEVDYDFYYNTSWQVLEIRKDGDTDPLKQYIWNIQYIDAPVCYFYDGNTDGSGVAEYYMTWDANFNVTAIVPTVAVPVERYSYDPYGSVTILDAYWTDDADQISDVDNDVLYCGYRFDAETGLYHVRNRYLHPRFGWITRDMLGYVDGMSLYEYVKSVPVIYQDPHGLQAADEKFLCCVDEKSGKRVKPGQGIEVPYDKIHSEIETAANAFKELFLGKDLEDFGKDEFKSQTHSSLTEEKVEESSITEDKKKLYGTVREGVIDCFCDRGYWLAYLKDKYKDQSEWKDVVILARGVYSETTTLDTSIYTKLLLAWVIKNRKNLPNPPYPNTYEEVLKQHKQFSGWSGRAASYGQMKNKQMKFIWATSYFAAVIVDGSTKDISKGADHFYSPYQKYMKEGLPGWATAYDPIKMDEDVDYIRNYTLRDEKTKEVIGLFHGAQFIFLDLYDDKGKRREAKK